MASIKDMVITFINSLKSIFENFNKNELIEYFEKDFIDNKLALEVEIGHESHIFHVIQV